MKIIKRILIIFAVVIIALPLGFCAIWIERDKTTNIRSYSKYFGN